MKIFFSGAFFAIGLLAWNAAIGQDVSNVGEAEIELAAAKLAVAKAEAELAQAKLDALKQENSDVALIESNPEISLNSEIETSTVETPNIVDLASEAKPAIELAETANPLTSLQPNVIVWPSPVKVVHIKS